MSKPAALDVDDIQGIVLHGYPKLRFVRYFFLRFGDAAKARKWISTVTNDVTTIRRADTGPDKAVHLGLTFTGLRSLGALDPELNTFPTSFQQGMTSESSTDQTAPWDFGRPGPEVHAVVLAYDVDEQRLKDADKGFADTATAADISIVRSESGYRPEDSREHFGFRDGISDPVVEGSGKEAPAGQRPIRAGEFILGYANEYDELPSSPTVPAGLDPDGILFVDRSNSGFRDLGRNGTYLVVQKLRQKVGAFWRFCDENSAAVAGDSQRQRAIHLAACLVGRWPNGAPLVKFPDAEPAEYDSDEDFSFRGDQRGHRCPFGAHVRRANPRDDLRPDPEQSMRESRRHRLIRRGRSYGPRLPQWPYTGEDDVDRGLLFVAINASIHRQFEFVQQTWIDNPKFRDLYDDPDPIVGMSPSIGGETNSGGRRHFTIQKSPVRARLRNLPSFVELRGGAYFFLPSIRGLRYLARGSYAEPGRVAIETVL